MDQTRRQFLKVSSAGIAASAIVSDLASASDAAPVAVTSPEISVRVTDDKRRFEAAPAISWREHAPERSSSDAITLDPEKKFQKILGFGAAFTDAACYTFNRLDPAAREQLFHELFHPSEIGLSVCRTCIGASDYSTGLYSYDEGDPDPELMRFSIDHDRAWVVPMLREARKANPDLFLFSSPWSPPGWMKPNGSMLGGCMHRKSMPAYANYFVKFLQAYKSEGVPVQAITVQNEVDTEQDGRMPACSWPMEYEVDFVRQFLGPALEKNSIFTQIWIIDHNYNLWGRALGELETPGLRKYVNAIAWHGYVGQPEWMMRVQSAYPDLEMYWTEGGPDYTWPDYLTDWTKWGSNFAQILRNGCRSITGWNLALDEHGKPNIGPFSSGGVVTIHSQTKEITRSGQYWALQHFSLSIRRGAQRFDSQGTLEAVTHVAFANSEGPKTLLLSNAGAARPVTLQMGNYTAETTLSGNSLTTFSWA